MPRVFRVRQSQLSGNTREYTECRNGWFVRITRPKEEVQLWCEALKDKAEVIVGYEHRTNRVHCHIIVANVSCTYQTIKNAWREVWSGLGHDVWSRSDWSFKPLEEGRDSIINTMTYCSKGTMLPFTFDGVYAEDCLDARNRWEDKPRVTRRQLKLVESLNPIQMRKKKNQICDEIIERLNRSEDQYTHRNVVMTILDYLKTERIIFSRFTVREYYDTIMCRIEHIDWQQRMRLYCNFAQNNNVWDE